MKLILVSDRLPLSVTEEDGQLRFTESPGGFAAGLRTYLASAGNTLGPGHLWVGWPGSPISPQLQGEAANRGRSEYAAKPVFLSAEDAQDFHQGLCRQTLWPLFHYLADVAVYDEPLWEGYERVNRLFCEAVLEVAEPGDLVWVHDYHLMLLPEMLKRAKPGLRVGFFLHTPFPAFEIFRSLPGRWRSAVLRGLLGADLVGFHTHDYAQHFLTCVRRLLGHDHEMGQVVLSDRVCRAETFPLGIDFDAFSVPAGTVDRPPRNGRLVLSLDRLDRAKGVTHRLLAYRTFLQANPAWHGKVGLLLVAVPSTAGIPDDPVVKDRVDKLIGDINGQFGNPTWAPVTYQSGFYPHDQLVPLYRTSDVLLFTPLRDGMGLVAKEYVASRDDGRGVLVLSETAGAASELGEALMVNPNDLNGTAEALRTALEMPPEEQARRLTVMRQRLRRYDVGRWATEFLGALQESRSYLDRRLLSPAARDQVLTHYRSAARRLLLCDYDGTLVPLQPTPAEAQPDPALPLLLSRLALAGEVAVVSGRPRDELVSWFGGLPVSLVAEHGIAVRQRGQTAWAVITLPPNDWKASIRTVMELYVDRLPGSFVEEKEYALAWHYRLAEPDLAAQRSRELADHLIHLTETADLKVIEGRKVIEVKPAGASKGTACQPMLAAGYDFVLALGDDTTDEDLFRALPPSAYSVRVGLTKTYARFNVTRQGEIRELLQALADLAPNPG